MHTVLVADDNTAWLEALSMGIDNEPDFKVVANTTNGKTTLELIENLRPDIMILDIIMPECDGVYIVNYVRQNMPDYSPIIYMLSGIGSDAVITILNELDIDFYSMKPITLQMTIANLKQIVMYKNRKITPAIPQKTLTRDQVIQMVLGELGLQVNLMSTKYIFQAVQYYETNPESFEMLTKILYPHIAKINNNTPGAVEKNIRTCIKKVSEENTELFSKIFKYYSNKKITNSIFLNSICSYVDNIYEKTAKTGKGEIVL